MTKLELLEYIGEADDKYILESRRRPKAKKANWPMALAACAMVAVMLGTGGLLLWNRSREPDPEEYATMEGQLSDLSQASAAGLEEIPETGAPKPVSAYGLTPLAQAQLPEAIAYDDYEKASDNWMENQVTEDTHYALKAFAYSTAAKVLPGQTESGCYSPLSLYQALSVLASGAEGSTQAELLSLLGQPDMETLQDQSGKLYRVNSAENGADVLRIANSLWLDETAADGTPVSYKQEWVLSAAMSYYADVYQAEFSEPETGEALGAWIAEKTGGFLQPRLNFSDDTLMAIVNTLWYRSHWREEFNEQLTETGDFQTGVGETVSTEFMHKTDSLGNYVQGENYIKSTLGLSRGYMEFILPDEGVDVDSLLSEESLWDIFENNETDRAEVRWSVPKFETDVTYDLGEMLQSLGVTTAFTDAADFSAISDTPLFVSNVQQGTHIALNEEGVEAAAYTVAVLAGAEAPMEEAPPVIEMNLNRPFIYRITADDGSTLFIGVVRNPLQ